MDPDATFRQLVDGLTHLKESDDSYAREEVVKDLRNLAEWLERGGFPPDVLALIASPEDS